MSTPCVSGRRVYEPVETLPRPRHSMHDRHHLFWPRTDFQRLGLSDFRGISCTSARRLDSMVHSVIHQRYSGVTGLNDPAVPKDLDHRANGCIERHDRMRCSCYRPRQIRVIDALTMQPYLPRKFYGPPCTGLAVDVDVFELMRDYIGVWSPVTENVRQLLAERCRDQLCGCYLQIGTEMVRRTPAWRNALELVPAT